MLSAKKVQNDVSKRNGQLYSKETILFLVQLNHFVLLHVAPIKFCVQ